MTTQIDHILHYWFGAPEKETLPSEHATWIWFSSDAELDKEITLLFQGALEKAIAGEYNEWAHTPRGALALIILLDQISRHVYRGTPQSFAQDARALEVCLESIEHSLDHQLSLIERVFFYSPLMHSENLEIQNLSVRAYQVLAAISFEEVRPMFQRFLERAVKHRDIIRQFGRFPDRNVILSRSSTEQEKEFLKTNT